MRAPCGIVDPHTESIGFVTRNRSTPGTVHSECVGRLQPKGFVCDLMGTHGDTTCHPDYTLVGVTHRVPDTFGL